jgi:SAM-dependent methyltransferase
MDIAEYSRIATAEDAHWWYRGTRSLMRQLLEPDLRAGMQVLDAGCGPGGNSAWLLPGNHVTGLDVSPEALRFARDRHPEMTVRRGDITDLPFADESFDLVLVITVLYLVDDDVRALREVTRVLRPGGTAFLLEPANPRLHRDHDVVVRARRRYNLAELHGLAEVAGLEVHRATYAYSFLLVPAALLSLWHKVKGRQRSDLSDLQRDRLGWLFAHLAALERRFLNRFDLPFGLSAVVLAERRS